eukprot:SAG31_NODE_1361_length_8631_cov_3.401899_4_plen_169_part_00
MICRVIYIIHIGIGSAHPVWGKRQTASGAGAAGSDYLSMESNRELEIGICILKPLLNNHTAMPPGSRDLQSGYLALLRYGLSVGGAAVLLKVRTTQVLKFSTPPVPTTCGQRTYSCKAPPKPASRPARRAPGRRCWWCWRCSRRWRRRWLLPRRRVRERAPQEDTAES